MRITNLDLIEIAKTKTYIITERSVRVAYLAAEAVSEEHALQIWEEGECDHCDEEHFDHEVLDVETLY